MRLLAYLDRWNARPGEELSVFVSSTYAEYDVEVVRLRRGGPRSGAAPVVGYDVVETAVSGTHTGREQLLRPGSYVAAPGAAWTQTSFTVAASIRPTLPTRGRPQGLVTRWDAEARTGAALYLDPVGRPAFRWAGASGWERVVTARRPCSKGGWTFVACAVDAVRRTVTLVHGDDVVSRELGEPPAWPDDGVPVLLAAFAARADRSIAGAYNGRLERPRIFDRALTSGELLALARDADVAAEPVSDWRFEQRNGHVDVHDRGPAAAHGRAVNAPVRAVTGHLWDGSVLTPQLAPEQYGAIHFHEDDVGDAGWEESFRLSLPEGLASGAYALRLSAGIDVRFVPFFVRVAEPSARALLLLPTLTYLAYSNRDTMAMEPFEVTGRAGLYDPIDPIIHDHPELGWSTYSEHLDGSGVVHASLRRPIINLGPDHGHWLSGGGGWNFSGDMFIIDWLEAQGFAYDVATDHDLHAEGSKLLAPYTTVLTGMHPEYTTGAMLDGFADYLDRGGRLMYLGGNGFYWVTSIAPDRPDLLEVRRGHAGTRTWTSEPGEVHHASTLEPGGLWRHRGRAPQRLFGVGFAAEGGGGGAPYVRTKASHDPRVAFMFDGVSDEGAIGDYGHNQGAASGDEIDRADVDLGTRPHALVVATSSGLHSDLYQRAIEEVPVMLPGQGGTECAEVRADVVFFETPSGGAVFATGSINWAGSLSHADYDNDIARLTGNVLHRFLAPEPFTAPAAS